MTGQQIDRLVVMVTKARERRIAAGLPTEGDFELQGWDADYAKQQRAKAREQYRRQQLELAAAEKARRAREDEDLILTDDGLDREPWMRAAGEEAELREDF